MKKYIVELSETANQDLNNIISYLRYTLSGDIIADKYKILFKQALIDLEFGRFLKKFILNIILNKNY